VYEYCSPFNEGLAKVMIGQEWGYINTSGEVVIEPQYLYAEDFDEGVARVENTN